MKGKSKEKQAKQKLAKARLEKAAKKGMLNKKSKK
jgi:hypothetical protein